MRRTAAGTEAAAVVIFTIPEIKDSGFDGAHISVSWITPQARIKIPKQPIIQRKGRFFRCRTRLSRVNAIEK